MSIDYSSPLILLQFELEEAAGERNGGIVIGTGRRPSPLADADRFGPSISVHQVVRGVGIAENGLGRQRRRRRRRSPLERERKKISKY